MQRNFVEVSDLTPDQRRREIARILADGIVRLRSRAALPTAVTAPPASEKPAASSPNCLEVSGETRLSVHTG